MVEWYLAPSIEGRAQLSRTVAEGVQEEYLFVVLLHLAGRQERVLAEPRQANYPMRFLLQLSLGPQLCLVRQPLGPVRTNRPPEMALVLAIHHARGL